MKSGKVRPVDQTEMCAECVARQLWRSDLTPCLRDIAKKRRRKRWSSSWTAGYRWSKFALVLQSTFSLQCCWFGVAWKVERIVCVVSGLHEKFLLMPFSSRKLQRIEQLKKKKCIAEEKWGTRKKACKAKCFIFLEWNSMFGYFKEGIRRTYGTTRSVHLFIPFDGTWIPHVSALRLKKTAFELWFSCSFSDVCIYTYVYICLYRDLFLPWR